MSNDQTKNQAATGMAGASKLTEAVGALQNAKSTLDREQARVAGSHAHIDAANQYQFAIVKLIEAALAAPASAQPAEDEILVLHRQLAAEKLRADQGWQRAEAKSRECTELRERMASAQPDRGAAPEIDVNAIRDIADELSLEASNYEGDFADTVNGCADALHHLLAAPLSQPVRGVPDGWRLVPAQPTAEMLKAGAESEDRHFGMVIHNCYVAMLAAAPSPAAQPVAPAAPTYWNSQQKMISRAIIGLRDGWATRKDADDALAALAAATAAAATTSELNDQQIIDCFTKAGYWLGTDKDQIAKAIQAVKFAIHNRVAATTSEDVSRSGDTGGELLNATAAKITAHIERNKEALLAAWIAENGVPPSEAVLCQQTDWASGVQRCWVERHPPSRAPDATLAATSEDALDAAMFRWLRDEAVYQQEGNDGWYEIKVPAPLQNDVYVTAEQFDMQVRAAMRATQQEGGK